MRAAATALLAAVPGEHRASVQRPVTDPELRWLEYSPAPRPGVCLADLDRRGRKAAHRLLATALTPHAYAQAMAIVALEEVLDRAERWRKGRHSNDYWVIVFGEPGDDEWAWRFEGHHLSVTITVSDGEVFPTPVFLGANPAAVRYADRTVLRPLAIEEDLARDLLDAMGPAGRVEAIVANTAPADIHSGPSPRAATIEPFGVRGDRLPGPARALLGELTAAYLARLPAELTWPVDPADMHFAWEGGIGPGEGHYYRVQGPDLLIEYDNTADDANHAHTVLRRPRADFGGDALARHRASAEH
ncbi:MAG TPA: DUF3500 domain-containing protein [Micromonosporaceae bacterium]|nr:DUF3500 domain-containing protein [Micromonosporaceae bacterium]